MTGHHEIPTPAQLDALWAHRGPSSVSIYLPTDPSEGRSGADATRFAASAGRATDQLVAVGASADEVEAVRDQLDDLAADDEFWARRAESLAVLASPSSTRTFRLANHLGDRVSVSDRFHLTPLVRAVTFPQAAYVLALAAGGARLLEIGPEGPPEEVKVPDLPRDAWDPRSNKVVRARDRAYVRAIDDAIRPWLTGSSLPLVVAATETIDALYRTVSTAPQLVERRVPGNPEEATDAELAAAVRPLLDERYAQELSALGARFDEWAGRGRAATDLVDLGRLSTLGAIDTLIVDLEASAPGSVDDHSGAVAFASGEGPGTHDVIDEIARRTHLARGRVVAVRQGEVPGGGQAAALLRYVPAPDAFRS